MDSITGKIIASTPERDTAQVALTMVWAIFFGIAAVSATLWDQGTIWRGLLWAGAWSSIGWFLGFLFGIPRFLSTDTARTPGAGAIERSRQELAKATELANSKRGEVEATMGAKALADKSASECQQQVVQAEAAAALTTAQLENAPMDSSLAEAAKVALLAAERAKQGSEAATTSATAAAEKVKAAESAAAEALAAVDKAKASNDKAIAEAAVAPKASLTVNTNLEQISDWLTKIIVGVSLVESQALLDMMRRAATFMAKSMAKASDVAAWAGSSAVTTAKGAASAADAVVATSVPASGASGVAMTATQAIGSASFCSMESVAYALMLYFLATGLLGSYLLTRLFLQRALDNAAVTG